MSRVEVPASSLIDEAGIEPIGPAPGCAPAEAATAPVVTPAVSDARARRQFWTIVGSHVIVDIYPSFFATLAIALRRDLQLSDAEIAIIYASNQVLSGLPQSLAAWLSDRYDTRIAAPVGLVASAVCSCMIGFAPNFWVLWALLAVAMVGNGIYHPIAGAQAGQIGGPILRHGRAQAVSMFFAAGMIGSAIGPLASTRLYTGPGPMFLAVLMPLGLLTAWALRMFTSDAAHRAHDHRTVGAAIPDSERRVRWTAVWVLYVGNAMRFIVNTAMFMLFNLSASRLLPGDKDAATILNGNMVVAMTIGMGAGALFAARMVKPGSERGGILVLSMLGAVFTALTSWAGHAVGIWGFYVCAALTSLGFASILPLTIGLAQRLLPHRTGLASSLMMGGSWGLAAVTPLIVRAFLGASTHEAEALPQWRVDLVYALFGVILLGAGLLAQAIPGWIVRKVGGAR